MEQWQFLIQKQGERVWQSLESPHIEIIEGRYRVVARSQRTNTDVEVRVTHLSPTEIPPRRRIHKRLRRTNSEGLMAVIPFTYFAPGMWEIRCSGDLMSDMLGTPWHHILRLQVLPQAAATEIRPVNCNTPDSSDLPLPTSISVASSLPVPPVPPNFSQVINDTNKLFVSEAGEIISYDEQQELAKWEKSEITPELKQPEITPELKQLEITPELKQLEITPELKQPEITPKFKQLEITVSSNVSVLEETHNQDDTVQVQNIEEAHLEVNQIELASPTIASISTTKEELQPLTISSLETEISSDTNKRLDISIPAEDAFFTDNAANQESDLNTPVELLTDEPIRLSTGSIIQQIRQYQVEEAIVDQPVSPVWVKGDSAEQILHNLIELALPSSEPFVEEMVDASKEETALPLLISLEEQIYIARWGRPFTIYGRVQLPVNVDSNAANDAFEFESVCVGQLKVELRSPLSNEVLSVLEQSLPEKLLPFGFEYSIEIPANCQSKLILACVNLYGALGGVGNPQLLASQSFSVTADVAELLAISATVKPTEPDMLDYALAQMTPEPTPLASLDLELFNLAKNAKPSVSLVFQPSPKRILPLEVEPRRGNFTAASLESGQPFSEGNDAIAIAQTSTGLPFLRKRKALLLTEDTSTSYISEESEDFKLPVDYVSLLSTNEINHDEEVFVQETDKLVPNDLQLEHLNQTKDDLVTSDLEYLESVENIDDIDDIEEDKQDEPKQQDKPVEKRIITSQSQLITANRPYMSPLIQKWMQKQGYSVSETINLAYQDYDTNLMPSQGIPDTVSATSDDSINEDQENKDDLVLDVELPTVSDLELDVVPIINDSELNIDSLVLVPSQEESSKQIKKSSAILAREIVIDDFLSEDDDIDTILPTQEQLISDVLSSLGIEVKDIEPLPVPLLQLPKGELVSGKTIQVRVLLPVIRPQTAVKLWVEDCQTRWLLEGPHLITDLLPNPLGEGMEAFAELNIPFGCLEIRIEAISLDIPTQQESHKASIQRSVIPPDLPTFQMDELLGI